MALSLLVFAATAGLWVRSYRWAEGFVFNPFGRFYGVVCFRGSAYFGTSTEAGRVFEAVHESADSPPEQRGVLGFNYIRVPRGRIWVGLPLWFVSLLAGLASWALRRRALRRSA